MSFDLNRIEWGQHPRGPFKMMPISAILRIDFGDANRPRASLCLSISSPSRSIDLIAQSEREVEAWVLGLNEVVPYRLERQKFTAQEFRLRRAMLRLEVGDGDEPHVMSDRRTKSLAADQDCDGLSGCTSTSSKTSMTTCSRQPSATSGRSGSESVRSRFRNMIPGKRGTAAVGM